MGNVLSFQVNRDTPSPGKHGDLSLKTFFRLCPSLTRYLYLVKIPVILLAQLCTYKTWQEYTVSVWLICQGAHSAE